MHAYYQQNIYNILCSSISNWKHEGIYENWLKEGFVLFDHMQQKRQFFCCYFIYYVSIIFRVIRSIERL